MSTLKVSAINNEAAASGGLLLGADGNVTGGGMDLIRSQSFGPVSTVSVDDCFSADYDDYKIIVLLTATTTGSQARMRMRAAGVDAATSYRYANVRGAFDGATLGCDYSTGVTEAAFYLFGVTTTGGFATLDVMSPALASYTYAAALSANGVPAGPARYMTGFLNDSVSYDGFSLLLDSGTITGKVRVYGYKK